MTDSHIAHATITIDAPPADVFDALINPKAIKAYMFGADASSDWKEGSEITWKGEFNGKPFEDQGKVLEIHPPHRLKYSHISKGPGKPDQPETKHTVSINLTDLTDERGQTQVAFSQDGNATEQAQQEAQKNWEGMLAGLKKYVESNR
ncbi:MAG: SRPBCC domain-containing protein [Vicinamibacteria bacterium]